MGGNHRGTFWMHSHWAWQSAMGLSAPIVIRDTPAHRKGIRDVMFMLQEIHIRMVCEFDALIYPEWCGPDPSRNDRIATTTQFTVQNYTFLANKREVSNPWVEEVRAGETIRVRILHAGTKITYMVQLAPELSGTAKVVATDGYDTEPADLVQLPCIGVISSTSTNTSDSTSTSSNSSNNASMLCSSFPIAQAQRTDLLVTIPKDFKTGYYPIVGRRRADCTRKDCFGQVGHVQVGMLLKVMPAADSGVEDANEIAKPEITHSFPDVAIKTMRADHFTSTLKASPHLQLPDRRVTRHMDMNLTAGYQWFPNYGINGKKWYLLQEHAFVNEKTGVVLDIDPELHEGETLATEFNLLMPSGTASPVTWYDGAGTSTVPPLGPTSDALTRLPVLDAYAGQQGHHLTVPCDVCMACLNDDEQEQTMPWHTATAREGTTKAKWCARKTDVYTFGYSPLWGYNTTRQVLAVACSGWVDVAKVTSVAQCSDWKLSKDPIMKKNPHAQKMCRGERVEMTIRNDMHMSVGDGHPMHLHGVTAQVVSSKLLDPTTNTMVETKFRNGPRRDTFWVAPGGEVTVIFDAVNPGEWMFHCHIDDHAESGMSTSLTYYDDESGMCNQEGAGSDTWGKSQGNSFRRLRGSSSSSSSRHTKQ